MKTIAFFITPHGFGHAARSCAIIDEIQRLRNDIRILIFTTVPKEFFADSLGKNFYYYSTVTDIGFIQKSSLDLDIPWTIKSLNEFYPLDTERLSSLFPVLDKWHVKLIVSDISPMGIQIAKMKGIRSVLVQNFTWDWIYGFYATQIPKFQKIATILHDIYKWADHTIKAVPYCTDSPSDITVPPISRRVRKTRDQVRSELGIEEGQRMVLITMGGVPEEMGFLTQRLLGELREESIVVVACSNREYLKREENAIYLPRFSQFYHPDLVNAADGVMGKLGYATIAEVVNSGVPFAFVMRDSYPETDRLKEYVNSLGNTLEVSYQEFRQGDLAQKLKALPSLGRRPPRAQNGALQAGQYILHVLEQW
jgi:hypothetical protein